MPKAFLAGFHSSAARRGVERNKIGPAVAGLLWHCVPTPLYFAGFRIVGLGVLGSVQAVAADPYRHTVLEDNCPKVVALATDASRSRNALASGLCWFIWIGG